MVLLQSWGCQQGHLSAQMLCVLRVCLFMLCGRCLVVNSVGRQIHYIHAIKHVGEISRSCKGSPNKSERFIHIQTNIQVWKASHLNPPKGRQSIKIIQNKMYSIILIKEWWCDFHRCPPSSSLDFKCHDC